MSEASDTRPLLVLEDNNEDFATLQRLMRKQGLTNPVFHCVTGQEVLDFLRHQGPYRDSATAPRPSLILLDLNVPGKDGRTVLQEIKSDEAFKHIPVAIFSTSANAKDIAFCYAYGANTYLVKPVDLGKLTRNLQMFFEYWLRVSVLRDDPQP
jgi:CheY-like chemotaxis protein